MSDKITRRAIIKKGGFVLTALSLPFPLMAFTKVDKMTCHKKYDVIIIGGSYSGLSAAMALGRSLRSVLIIDGGLPCNRQTPHSHNFITHDGEKPGEIAEKAKAQVLKYKTVEFLKDFAISGRKTENGFTLETRSGEYFHAKKLVFATGIKDTMPDIKGFAECWGISVVHCPYCHGYELRGKKTAIFANGQKAFHLASLVNNLTTDLSILTSGKADFNEEQIGKLKKHNINIIEAEVTQLEHENGYVKSVVFKDGRKVNFDGVYGVVPFTQHSNIPVELGCEITDQGYIKADMFQKTSVENVFACGDNSSMMRSLANAVYTGNIAGVMANMELTNENF